MPIAHVQSAQVYGETYITLNGISVGSLLVACISGASSLSDTTVSDNQGGIWAALSARGPSSGGPTYARIFYSMNHPGGNTIVTISNPPVDHGWTLAEYSGAALSSAFDEENYKDNSTYDTGFESNGVTVTSGALIVSFLADEINATTVDWDTGWTERQEDLGHVHSMADRIVSSAGSYEATGVRGSASSSSLVLIAAFNSAVSLPPRGPHPMMHMLVRSFVGLLGFIELLGFIGLTQITQLTQATQITQSFQYRR